MTCRVIDGAELAALTDALGPDTGAMACLGAVLGLRWGECAGLRVGRLDFLAGTITIAEQLTSGAKGAMVAAPPKSEAGRRTLAVPRPLMDLLAEHLARRGLTGADAEAFVFVAPQGGPLNYSTWRTRVWEPATRAVGLDGLRFHDLRRAAATALVLDGVDLKTAQARLGHSTPVLTLGIYAQASETADREAADKLGARWLPATPRHPRAMEGG